MLCRAWWNDIKNTVVHCADCCSCEKALALAEFGTGIWSWSRLALSLKQRCVKDLFANWRGAFITHRSSAQVSDICHWCVMETDLHELKLWRFLWPLSCITKCSGTPASSRRKIDALQVEWLDQVQVRLSPRSERGNNNIEISPIILLEMLTQVTQVTWSLNWQISFEFGKHLYKCQWDVYWPMEHH